MEFPDDWPQGCPPDDAEPADGVVYRLVKNKPPTESDFLSHHETGRLPNAPACLRCGLSVFRDLADAVHQRRLLPRLGRYVARGELEDTHGKTRLTSGQQPTHTTWWPFVGVNRSVLFTVIEEGA